MRTAWLLWLSLLALSAARADEIPFHQYRLLERGMSSAEVQYRVGAPDRETLVNTQYVFRRIWYYLPERSTGGWLSRIEFGPDDRVDALARHRVSAGRIDAGGGLSLRDFSLLDEGMSSGEVYLRIGPPDRETLVSNERGFVKIWYYLPQPQDRAVRDRITRIEFDARDRVRTLERTRP